jgi:hypothetical protein
MDLLESTELVRRGEAEDSRGIKWRVVEFGESQLEVEYDPPFIAPTDIHGARP